jgi:hypothetical protein
VIRTTIATVPADHWAEQLPEKVCLRDPAGKLLRILSPDEARQMLLAGIAETVGVRRIKYIRLRSSTTDDGRRCISAEANFTTRKVGIRYEYIKQRSAAYRLNRFSPEQEEGN